MLKWMNETIWDIIQIIYRTDSKFRVLDKSVKKCGSSGCCHGNRNKWVNIHRMVSGQNTVKSKIKSPDHTWNLLFSSPHKDKCLEPYEA